MTTAVFSPDGKRVLTASWDKTARLWDVASGRLKQQLIGHSSSVEDAAFSPDGRLIVTAAEEVDKTARVWDAERGELLRVLEGHDFGVLTADRSIVAESE